MPNTTTATPATTTEHCPTCGSTDTVHGDCLVCNSPLAARTNQSSSSRRAHQSMLSVDRTVDSVVDALRERFSAKTVTRHLDELPASYLLRTPATVIGDHIALIERAGGATAVEHNIRGGVDRLTVVTSDRPGILSILAGMLAAHGVNITGAAAHTKSSGIAIDVLYVEFCPAARATGSWQQLCNDLTNALNGDVDLDASVRDARVRFAPPAPLSVPTTVYVDTEASSHFTRIEVNAADRVGLLYAISRSIASLGRDIHFANVETVGEMAVDTFFLSRQGPEAADDPSEIERLKSAIVTAVDSL